MLQDYERKVNIAAGAFLLAVAGMLALDQWNPTDANIWEAGDFPKMATYIVGFCGYWYSVWCYAKAKGYPGMVGVMLFVFGLLVLVLLPDRQTEVEQPPVGLKKRAGRHAHLNGWQRIGVILSFLWASLVMAVAATESLEPKTSSLFYAERADKRSASVNTYRATRGLASSSRRILTDEEVFGPTREFGFRLGTFVGALLVPPALAWLLAYLTISVLRWVVAGFRSGKS